MNDKITKSSLSLVNNSSYILNVWERFWCNVKILVKCLHHSKFMQRQGSQKDDTHSWTKRWEKCVFHNKIILRSIFFDIFVFCFGLVLNYVFVENQKTWQRSLDSFIKLDCKVYESMILHCKIFYDCQTFRFIIYLSTLNELTINCLINKPMQ